MPDRLRIERESRVTIYRLPEPRDSPPSPPPSPPPSTPSSTGGEASPDLAIGLALFGGMVLVGLGIVVYCYPTECLTLAGIGFFAWLFTLDR